MVMFVVIPWNLTCASLEISPIDSPTDVALIPRKLDFNRYACPLTSGRCSPRVRLTHLVVCSFAKGIKLASGIGIA